MKIKTINRNMARPIRKEQPLPRCGLINRGIHVSPKPAYGL
ncbi:MAG TPA: hypothetical protein VMC42_02135 [Methanoregulaceae archaeon]|nr:hypothetical protein [Methanoregulaceae archaeon]